MKTMTDKELWNKKRFTMFLELIGLSKTSINAYATTLMSCSDMLSEMLSKDGLNSLLEVESLEQILKYQQILETTPAFISRNHTGNNRHSASMVNYVKFVDFLTRYKKK